ncbi:AraC family transcriptional regulator [Streptomyces sp. HNM0663]|uniref:AraC family transcriptional regulator n=1 Tax=Streptomyces chengmaiensis TaxID=3040919 RepID=A0ABT6HKC8_9ACTN|nr:AraC family transcriptional regulator [Streptomyces chengmaiensis]MDH2389197.1 AraC family transcriptional regulator [Streptomyces chengmaiensis]
MVNSTMAPMEIESEHAGNFHSRMRVIALGSGSLWPVTQAAARYDRPRRLIRVSDPGLIHLTVLRPGSSPLAVDADGQRHITSPGGIYLLDSSRPYTVHSTQPDMPVIGYGAEIPGHLLDLPPAGLGHLAGAPLETTAGFGALIKTFVTRLDPASHHASDGPHLINTLAALISGLARRQLTDHSHHDRLWQAATTHIDAHLEDPALAPATVAAAVYVSLRQLQRAFADHGTTIAAYIRHQRLDHARRCLRTTRDTSIAAVAARYGFASAAHFSRTYKAAYGHPPTADTGGRRAGTPAPGAPD